jgi:hypothetical protein
MLNPAKALLEAAQRLISRCRSVLTGLLSTLLFVESIHCSTPTAYGADLF